MTSNYNRSEILSFWDLTESQQAENIDNLGQQLAEETSYVIYEGDALPLCMFMRTERGNNFTHGIYSLSAFSGYFITISRSNDCATVAYKHF